VYPTTIGSASAGVVAELISMPDVNGAPQAQAATAATTAAVYPTTTIGSPTASAGVVAELITALSGNYDFKGAIRAFFAANPQCYVSPQDFAAVINAVSFSFDKGPAAAQLAELMNGCTCAHASAALATIDMEGTKIALLRGIAPFIPLADASSNGSQLISQFSSIYQRDAESVLKSAGSRL
jgi:hypothetical protein